MPLVPTATSPSPSKTSPPVCSIDPIVIAIGSAFDRIRITRVPPAPCHTQFAVEPENQGADRPGPTTSPVACSISDCDRRSQTLLWLLLCASDTLEAVTDVARTIEAKRRGKRIGILHGAARKAWDLAYRFQPRVKF